MTRFDTILCLWKIQRNAIARYVSTNLLQIIDNVLQ